MSWLCALMFSIKGMLDTLFSNVVKWLRGVLVHLSTWQRE